jgi:hypothetical protein
MKKRRKLRLNRETLRQLDAGHLRAVAGGETEIEWQCETGPATGPETICNDTTCHHDTYLACETGPVLCGTYAC